MNGNLSSKEKITEENPDYRTLYEQASQLHQIQALSQSYLQIVIQVYFVVMLVLMGGATLIAGVDAPTFFSSTCEFIYLVLNAILNGLFLFTVPLTAVAIVISFLNLMYAVCKSHVVDLNKLKMVHNANPDVSCASSLSTYTAWFIIGIMAAVVSLVALCVLAWVEIFSVELLTEKVGLGIVQTNHVYILPIIIVLLPVPINSILYYAFFKNIDSFSYGQGLLSAVFPSK